MECHEGPAPLNLKGASAALTRTAVGTAVQRGEETRHELCRNRLGLRAGGLLRLGESGEISAEGLIPANEDGLARLVLEQGTDVRAAVEMMSGAVWVRDRLEASGWEVQVATPARSETSPRSPARRQGRRPGAGGALPARPGPRALDSEPRGPSAPRAPAPARPPGQGPHLGPQPDLRPAHPVRAADLPRRLRKADPMELLASRGVPEVWRASIAELIELVRDRIGESTSDRELGPIASSTSGRSCSRRSRGGAAAQPHLRRGDRRGRRFPGSGRD